MFNSSIFCAFIYCRRLYICYILSNAVIYIYIYIYYNDNTIWTLRKRLVAPWRKRLDARLTPLESRHRVSVTPCGFRGGRKRGLGRFFPGFLSVSPTKNFISPFLHTHLIHFLTFNFMSLCNGTTGGIGRHPCYSLTFNIGAEPHSIPHRIIDAQKTFGVTGQERPSARATIGPLQSVDQPEVMVTGNYWKRRTCGHDTDDMDEDADKYRTQTSRLSLKTHTSDFHIRASTYFGLP